MDKIIVYEDRIEWHMKCDTNEYYAMKISGESNDYNITWELHNCISSMQGKLQLLIANSRLGN